MKSKAISLCIACLVLFGVFIGWNNASGGLLPQEQPNISEVPGTPAIPQPTSDIFPDVSSDDRSVKWYEHKKPGQLKGVALVIHGLNLRPDRMEPIISTLTDSGIDALLLSLRGHGQNHDDPVGVDQDTARLEAFKSVSYPVWINEAYLAYMKVKERAEEEKAPVFLAAFSMGALVGLDLFASNPEVQFDKMVLFAPAIALRPIIYLERVLSPFPGWVIPSMAPQDYLANHKGTPVAAYNALFECFYHFEKSATSKIDVPTLVFIDEQDEFISIGGLKKLVEEKKLGRWKFYIVAKENPPNPDAFHHHILDESSTGGAVWQDMMKTVTAHLFNKSTDP